MTVPADNFKERLKSLMQKRRLKQKEVAKAIGVSGAAFSRYVGGRIPHSLQLQKLADFFQISPGYLLGYEQVAGTHKSEKKLPKREQDGPYWGKSGGWCPIISWASAGAGRDYEDQGDDPDGPSVRTDCKDANCYALAVVGDSMSPVYLEGDIIVVAPNTKSQHGDLVVARLVEGDVLFKRLEFNREMTRIRLVSFNPNYPVVEIGPDEVRFIHPVHSMIRFFKDVKA